MKTKIFSLFIIGMMIQAAVVAQQHNPPPSPAWVSEKGWWVVESNIHTPRQHIVYFYNNDGVLVYKEKIEGVRINPTKRNTRMLLKQVLESSVLAWENQHRQKENEALVINALRNK
jgi:hypothetical protein